MTGLSRRVFTRRTVRVAAARRTHRRTSRRAVFAGVVAFVALTAAFAVWVDGAEAIRDPAFAAKAQTLRNASSFGPGPSVVFFGSSRVWAGFDASRAESALRASGNGGAVAFNFGVPGSGIASQSLALNRLRRRGLRPDAVVVELFPAFLHDSPYGPVERRWLAPERLSRSERRATGRFTSATDETIPWTNTWRVMRSAIFRRTFPAMSAGRDATEIDTRTDARGYTPNEFRFRDETERTHAFRAQREFYEPLLCDLRLTGDSCERIARFESEERLAGTPVAFVLMPEPSTFRSWYGPESETRLGAFLASWNSPVVDARTWVSDEGFSDTNHLNVAGAVSFTDRFTAEVLLPWLGELRK